MTEKGSGTIPYPGGKTILSSWIIDHFPDHECYVEPFGGSASVLFNKPRSDIEVYNDVFNHVVTFFRICRDKPDELRNWVEYAPYSRDVHDRYVTRLQSGDAPDDDVKHAGMFWYVQKTSYGGGIFQSFNTHSTLSLKRKREHRAYKFENSKSQIDAIADRFREVIIESLDYADVIEKYDHDDALFYIDPPYIGTEGVYPGSDDFDHDRLVDTISSIDGMFVLSYEKPTPGLESVADTIVTRDRDRTGTKRSKESTETLLMNFDSDERASFAGANQSGLTQF